ncbi:hypothetical protein PESP_a2265 [Pseudoalteromonas espejiana DSM 9414]|nr:hypothetical protein PESP_a2265 [Pseudoalteromonas espejiana DSM 9414]
MLSIIAHVLTLLFFSYSSDSTSVMPRFSSNYTLKKIKYCKPSFKGNLFTNDQRCASICVIKVNIFLRITMLYMIYSTDVENSLSLRKEARPAHLARLSELDSQNRLFVAGPLPAIDSEDPQDAGFTGSLVIAEFESLEKAREWAAADPYVAAGVYANSVVKPYKKVLPA